MRLGYKIVGVPEAAGALNAMGDELGGQALVDAAEAGAWILVNTWKDYIKERAYRTGTYFRSIHQKLLHRSKGRVEIEVGTDIVDPPYPFFLEYGTSKMQARPTARPAFDESEDEVGREIEEALMQIVEKHWR